MTGLRRDTLIVPVTALLILLVDQATKHLVRAHLQVGQTLDLAAWLAPLIQITHVTNTGAAFGLFPQLSGVFVVVAVVVVVTILVYHRHLPQGHWPVRLALGLQLGGAIGNLVDRIRWGSVVDFLDVNMWPLRDWPVFNLADTSIVAGVTLLALLMVWEEWQEAQGQSEERVEEPVDEGSPRQMLTD